MEIKEIVSIILLKNELNGIEKLVLSIITDKDVASISVFNFKLKVASFAEE